MLYLTSTAIIPANADGVWTKRTISINFAKDTWRRADQKMSAIGHQSTAELIAKLLEERDSIFMNRLTVEPEPGDQFLVFQLKQRPPEGAVLSGEELEMFGHIWSIMKYESGPVPSGALDVSRKEFCVLQRQVAEIRRELDHRQKIGELMTLYPY